MEPNESLYKLVKKVDNGWIVGDWDEFSHQVGWISQENERSYEFLESLGGRVKGRVGIVEMPENLDALRQDAVTPNLKQFYDVYKGQNPKIDQLVEAFEHKKFVADYEYKI